MSVVVPRMAISKVAAAADPKRAIWDQVGDISKLKIPKDKVLVGIFIRSEKTKGGIIRPDVNIEEDVWQGKVGLILRFGTTAFQDTPDYKFHPSDIPAIGDWGVSKVGNAWSSMVNGYPCRLVRDVDFEMFPPNPDMIF